MPEIQVRSKLIFALSAILVVAFVVTSIINYRVSRDSIRKELMTSSLPLTGENIYSEIHSDLLKPINVSSLMANDTFLKTWAEDGEQNVDAIVDYLTRIREKYGFFAAFYVSNRTMHYYHPGGILKTVSRTDDHDEWFYDFIESDMEYDLDVDTNEAADNKLTIFINFRMENELGETLGVTGVGLEMDRVARLLKYYQRKYDRAIYMVNRDGVIQTHTDRSRINADYASFWGEMAGELQDVLIPRQNPRQYQVDRGDRHILISVRYIPEFDWFLVVEQDERSALSAARNNLIRTLIVGLVASAIIILLSVVTVNHFQEKLERMANTDELTGVGNRREFENQFERAQQRLERYGMKFCLILLDIDGLKQVNDNLGHLAGDEVISSVADLVSETVRGGDVVARWGGDEFIVLVEGDMDQARAAAERIRACVEEAELPELEDGSRKGGWVSVSLGLAQYRTGDTLDTLTHRADKALYEAKEQGRNLVRCEPV